jgi:hypothetical protein
VARSWAQLAGPASAVRLASQLGDPAWARNSATLLRSLLGGPARAAGPREGATHRFGEPWGNDGDSLHEVVTNVGGGGEDLDLDLLASSLRADDGDVRVLLRALVTRLSGALGQRLAVERAGRFRKGEEIRQVSISLGDDQFDATVDRGSLECTISRSSGGIRIRSSRVGIDEWLRRLLGSLRDEAATTEATRVALEALVIGNGS